MKKLTAVILSVFLVCSFGLSAFAAGTDDGTIGVATKDGQKFFGTEVTKGCVQYVAADGSGQIFYDLNGDKNMDICDLVALVNGEVDLDLSGTYDASDAKVLRLLLICEN